MKAISDLITKPVGEILREAGLINEGQVQVALKEQSLYSNLKLGEILALHGWIKQETADFFAEKIHDLIKKNVQVKIGNYFYQAGLLSQQEIDEILDEQQDLGLKFGSIAVSKGAIKQKTLDFFLKYFVLERADEQNLSIDYCNPFEI